MYPFLKVKESNFRLWRFPEPEIPTPRRPKEVKEENKSPEIDFTIPRPKRPKEVKEENKSPEIDFTTPRPKRPKEVKEEEEEELSSPMKDLQLKETDLEKFEKMLHDAAKQDKANLENERPKSPEVFWHCTLQSQGRNVLQESPQEQSGEKNGWTSGSHFSSKSMSPATSTNSRALKIQQVRIHVLQESPQEQSGEKNAWTSGSHFSSKSMSPAISTNSRALKIQQGRWERSQEVIGRTPVTDSSPKRKPQKISQTVAPTSYGNCCCVV